MSGARVAAWAVVVAGAACGPREAPAPNAAPPGVPNGAGVGGEAAARVSGGGAAEPVLAFAAADLREALAEAARRYRAGGGDSVAVVFGSTGELAEQIAGGAPADLFFAADQAAVDRLAERGAVVDSTRRVYAVGRVALVGACGAGRGGTPAPAAPPACPPPTLADLARPGVRAVAMANPAHAPYGRAARQVLERSGFWGQVEPKVVLAGNVAQAVQFVATGNADAGLVAVPLVAGRGPSAYTAVPARLHDPLRQTAAVVTASQRPAAARAFLRYVVDGDGQAVLRRHGLESPGP